MKLNWLKKSFNQKKKKLTHNICAQPDFQDLSTPTPGGGGGG